jgi:PAS domain S-box-containing protein
MIANIRRIFGTLPIVTVAVLYFLFAILSQWIIFDDQYVCAFWPAAGMGLVATWRRGWAGAAGVFIGSLSGSVVYFWNKLPAPEMATIAGLTAVGATVEALLAARVLGRLRGVDDLLDRFRTQMLFATCMVGCGIVSALFGVTATWACGSIKGGYGESLLLWSVGDMLGIILVAPCAFSFLHGKQIDERNVPIWVVPTYLAMLGAIAIGLFSISHPLTNVLLLALLASCFYFHQWWTLSAALMVAVIATYATMHGNGPLADHREKLNTHLNLYVFLFVVGAVSLTVSAGVQRRIKRATDEKAVAEQELMELSPVGIGLMDQDAVQFLRVNSLLAQELGYDSADAMQQNEHASNYLFSNHLDRAALIVNLRNAGFQRIQIELESRDINGQRMLKHLSARTVVRGKKSRILMFARDVTNKQRRIRVTELLGQIAHILSTAKPGEPWLHTCLFEANQKLEAKLVVLWLASKDRLPIRFEPHFNAYPEDDTFPVRECFDIDHNAQSESLDFIERIEKRYHDGRPHQFPIYDEETLVGVIVVHAPGWLFTERAGAGATETPNELPLDKVMRTVGQMLAEAYWRDIAEERNRRITEIAPVGIFYADAEGETVHINAECMKIQGMKSRAEMKDWPKKLTDECSERVDAKWKEYVANCIAKEDGLADPDPVHSDDEHYPHGLGVRTVHVRASTVRVQGEVAGFVGVLTDVTAYEEKLAALEDEKDNTKIRLHEINHDIKNSLYSLKASLDRLARCSELQTERHVGDWADDLARAVTCHDDIEGLNSSPA